MHSYFQSRLVIIPSPLNWWRECKFLLTRGLDFLGTLSLTKKEEEEGITPHVMAIIQQNKILLMIYCDSTRSILKKNRVT